MLHCIIIVEGEDTLVDEGIEVKNYSLFGLLGAIQGTMVNGVPMLDPERFVLVGSSEDLARWVAAYWPKNTTHPTVRKYD